MGGENAYRQTVPGLGLGSPPRRRGKEVADEGIGGIIVDDLVSFLDDLLVIFGGHIALFFPQVAGRSAAFQKSGKEQAVKGRAFCGVHWQASLSIFVRTIKLILV